MLASGFVVAGEMCPFSPLWDISRVGAAHIPRPGFLAFYINMSHFHRSNGFIIVFFNE